MKIEDQVCTLEQAKRLAELGIKTESLFEWIEFDEDDAPEITLIDRRYSRPNIHAYTVAELGEMLPAGICQTDKCPVDYGVKEWALYLAGDTFAVFMNNEAQARAAMLIHLIETGNLTPSQS